LQKKNYLGDILVILLQEVLKNNAKQERIILARTESCPFVYDATNLNYLKQNDLVYCIYVQIFIDCVLQNEKLRSVNKRFFIQEPFFSVYVNCLDKFRNDFPTRRSGKKFVSMYFMSEALSEVQHPRLSELNP
jgi:hypothetical protein